MSLLTGIDLSKAYGPNDIFSHISISIPQRARIGLVGPNGVGKTTLLRILTGEEEASSGEVQISRGVRIGYLPQRAHLDGQHTLWEECLKSFKDLLQIQAEMQTLEDQMSDPALAEAALEAYGRRQVEFDRLGGYTYEARIRQTLMGLGFMPGEEQRPIYQLSGGQRTRALLAQLLLSDPDVLLLDEPTNHLDIEAIEWLETYLKEWQGAVLIVSHDRYFLDQVCNVIWEMSPVLEIYRGNYSAYIAQRAERYQRRIEEYETQQAFIEKEEEYIRRNIAGQNTRQAQGRRKRLERLLTEALLTPPTEARKLHLRLETADRSGNLVIQTKALSVGYADEGRPLFRVPELILQRTEYAAVIGPNGAGKTTFLKTLLGQIPPYAGEVTLGASLKIGYFAQAHESLNPEHTLMEEIQGTAPNLRPAEIRDYLAKFLFTGDDVFKQVAVLSGGERGRLALACLALSGANLLLLDEPTNHLDLPSQEILQAVLADFQGTILLVSHDRYLIDALSTQIWEVIPGEGRLRIFSGTYSEYKAVKQAEAAQQQLKVVVEAPAARDTRPRTPSGPSKETLRKRAERQQALEAQITQYEQQLSLISSQLENPSGDSLKIQRLGQQYVTIQEQLEKLYIEWEEFIS
jgi:ATP-binding cassette subfamily F protein 3